MYLILSWNILNSTIIMNNAYLKNVNQCKILAGRSQLLQTSLVQRGTNIFLLSSRSDMKFLPDLFLLSGSYS